MIGQRLSEKGADAVYEVVAEVPGHGRYVLQRVDAHEPPFEASAGELEARFAVEAADPVEADPEAETRGWEALSRASFTAAHRAAAGVDPGPSPEEVFAAVADSEVNHG